MKVKGSSLLAVWLLVPGSRAAIGGEVLAREYNRTTALTGFNAVALAKNITRLEVGKEISGQLAAGETDTNPSEPESGAVFARFCRTSEYRRGSESVCTKWQVNR